MFHWRRRFNKPKYIICGLIAIVLIYYYLFSRYQTYEHQEVIKHAKAVAVWEFVADFSKMKLLNPTILDFKILSDQGNNEDWKYSVEYVEKLSHYPYWENTILGHFHVKKMMRNQEHLYVVESSHKVCFFLTFCLKSTGEFQIVPLNEDDTHVKEIVKYQCPPFVGGFCQREVEYQRKKIMQNLAYHFAQLYRQQQIEADS